MTAENGMADNEMERAWKDDFVIWEKGNRILHYTLRNHLVAVVGIEKSWRHFIYYVSAIFLRVFGSTSTVNVKTNWTSKQQVENLLDHLGEKKFRTIERKKIRASRDWIDGKWTNIRPKPDILSAVSAVLNPIPKPSQPPNLIGTGNSAHLNSNIHSIKTLQGPNNPSASSSEEVMPKTNKELHYKKQLITRYREEHAAKGFDNAGKVGTKSLQP